MRKLYKSNSFLIKLMQSGHSNIIQSLSFLREVITQRLNIFFDKENNEPFIFPKISLKEDDSSFSRFLLQHKMNTEEYTVLLLAFAPHIQATFFENIIQQYLPQGGDFIEFGGAKGNNYRGMMPTGETAIFILAGDDLYRRLNIQEIFSKDHFFYKEKILWLENTKEGDPKMSGRIILSEEFLHEWLFNQKEKQYFGIDFPAKNISTKMTWGDLVLNNYTLNQINDIQIWLQHNSVALQDVMLGRRIKPGYRVLFYGPSGTGKTLTATLLGKQFNRDVYRIDLSQIVSKYIGETEKNLEKIFSKAENKNWILFFDEADALFGKRTNVQSSHDRYANQEVSYLLQRVEDFSGLLILASNLKSNMDEAFLRRFHNIIHFPAPGPIERLQLWEKILPSSYPLEPSFNLQKMAEKYALNGAAILNVIHYAVLKSISRNDDYIRLNDITNAIQKEFDKDGKTIN